MIHIKGAFRHPFSSRLTIACSSKTDSPWHAVPSLLRSFSLGELQQSLRFAHATKPIAWLLLLLARMIRTVNQYLKSSKDARKRSDVARESSERHSGDLCKMKKAASDALDHVTQCTKRQDQREARELKRNSPATHTKR